MPTSTYLPDPRLIKYRWHSPPKQTSATRLNYLFVDPAQHTAAISTALLPIQRSSPSTRSNTLAPRRSHTNTNTNTNTTQCLQKQKRSQPPPERPPLARHPQRRRKPERKPPPPPRETRRSAARRERRPTHPTSTRSSSKCIPTLESPTRPCPSSTHLVRLLVRCLTCLVNDIFERVAGEASKLASYNKKSTISSREIQTAVRLILPGELAKVCRCCRVSLIRVARRF